MTVVDLTILGQTHKLTCKTGEEGRLKALSEKFNARAELLAQSLRTTDHKLIYIVAALTLLDEAEESKRQEEMSPEAERALELLRDKALEIKKQFI